MYVEHLLLIETLASYFHLKTKENRNQTKPKQQKEPSEDQFLRQYWNCINRFSPGFPLSMWNGLFLVNIPFKLKTEKETGKEGLLRNRAISDGSNLSSISSSFLKAPAFWHFPSCSSHPLDLESPFSLVCRADAFSFVKTRLKHHLLFKSILETLVPAVSLVPLQQ